MGTPRMANRDAYVWRSSWNEIGGMMFAATHAALIGLN